MRGFTPEMFMLIMLAIVVVAILLYYATSEFGLAGP
jgi:hypothetical protein